MGARSMARIAAIEGIVRCQRASSGSVRYGHAIVRAMELGVTGSPLLTPVMACGLPVSAIQEAAKRPAPPEVTGAWHSASA